MQLYENYRLVKRILKLIIFKKEIPCKTVPCALDISERLLIKIIYRLPRQQILGYKCLKKRKIIFFYLYAGLVLLSAAFIMLLISGSTKGFVCGFLVLTYA